MAVVNLMGTVYMESLRCPFETLESLLKTPDLPKAVSYTHLDVYKRQLLVP